MSITKVLEHLSGCSPEARYVLIRLWVKHSNTLPIKLKVSECAITMAMSRTTTSRAIEELIDGAHIDVKLEANRKGRKSRIFDVSGDLKQKLQNLYHPDAEHREQIRHLFLTRKTELKLDDKRTLSASNVVLLAALLGLANPCLVIRGAGTAKLRLLTGMSYQRLRLQLGKFQKANLIYHSVSGAAGSRMLGITTSTYWLSFKQPGLTVTASAQLEKALINLPSVENADMLFSELQSFSDHDDLIRGEYVLGEGFVSVNIIPEAKTEPDKEGRQPNSKAKIIAINLKPFLHEYKQTPLKAAFQTKLEELASGLACDRLAQTINKEGCLGSMHFLRRAYGEFLPMHACSKIIDANTPSKDQRKALVILAVQAASQIATEVVTAISLVIGEQQQIECLEIVPMKPGRYGSDRIIIIKLKAISQETSPKAP